MSSSTDASKEAYQRFLAKKYDQCLASLQSQLSSRGDPKILHNVAICEYFKEGCQDAAKFLTDTERLGKSLDKDRKIDHPNSIAAVEKFTATRAYRTLCFEFQGHEYVRFNEAVVRTHQRQYSDAVDCLLPMFYNEQQIAPLLYVRVVLLLLACTLAQYDKDNKGVTERAKLLLRKLEEKQGFIAEHEEEERSKQDQQPPMKLASQVLLLKAHFEALQGESQTAIELLQQYRSANAEDQREDEGWWPTVVHLNNLGMLHLGLGKPHLASLYLSKAIQTFEQGRPKLSPTANGTTSSMGSYPSMATVHYNNGLSHMIRGQYELAFKSFIVATPLLKDTAVMWLRLAQCCIKQWEAALASEQSKAFEKKQYAMTMSYASIPERKAVHLPTQDVLLPPGGKLQGLESSDGMGLVFAEKCLRNAHYLMLRRYRGRHVAKGKEEGDREKDDDEGDASQATQPADEGDGQLEEAALHGATASDRQASALLQAIYCNMAYTSLCLSDPAVTLTACQKLLSLPFLFKENRIVCLSYAAEAHCSLGCPEKALELLHKTSLADLLSPTAPSCLSLRSSGFRSNSPSPPSSSSNRGLAGNPIHVGSSQEDIEQMSSSHATALFTNLCIVHITTGKFGRAQQCLDQFKGDGQPLAELLQVYLHLASGNKAAAIEELRNHPPTPPFTVHV